MQQPTACTGEKTPKEDLKEDPNRDPKGVPKCKNYLIHSFAKYSKGND